ncbi:hypothetical protein [Amycolatopsis anabasis]|uniref:hypothetical protein n=1 Tax=Amycolatopsis anabasis TaxID=1840409 RepID=UPI00131DE856|nr:hypothetical protein [Amycolatopsis anabasis]
MRLGAGLLIALAVGASAAGWWLLAGIALAVPVALLRGRAVRFGAAARLALVPLYASVFAAYLVPGYPVFAALAFLAVLVVADALGARIPDEWRGWIAGLLVLAAGVLVVLSVSIEPVRVEPVAAPDIPGVLVAALVTLPLLTGRPRRWLAGSAVVALAVGAAALYQLGPTRLGLSVTSLRDVLAAADALALDPWLAAVVVLATVPAALDALGEAREAFALPRPRASAICGLVAALAAAVLAPVPLLFVAAAAAVVEVVAGFLPVRFRT